MQKKSLLAQRRSYVPLQWMVMRATHRTTGSKEEARIHNRAVLDGTCTQRSRSYFRTLRGSDIAPEPRKIGTVDWMLRTLSWVSEAILVLKDHSGRSIKLGFVDLFPFPGKSFQITTNFNFAYFPYRYRCSQHTMSRANPLSAGIGYAANALATASCRTIGILPAWKKE